MKVLLISPDKLTDLKESKGTLPMPLLHLAGALRKHGHQPQIYDLSTLDRQGADEAFYLQELAGYIERERPGLVGINCFTTLHFPAVLQIAEFLKGRFPALPIATGGAHPSLFPKEILNGTDAIDFVCTGESEEQIGLLADAVEADKPEMLKAIQSICYRENGQAIENPRLTFIDDLDALADPAWDLIDLGDYSRNLSSWNNPKGLQFNLSVPILTSRSCPFTCTFCACFTTMGRKYRTRSIERVVDEIQMLHEQHGQNYFGFIDDVVNIKKKHFIGILNEIVRRGLNIQFETTCGVHIASLNDDVIAAMAGAGCAFVRLPIEHGNDEMRNSIIGKHLKREKIYEVVEAFKKHNVMTSSMFIMGFPEETSETLQDTYDIICDLEMDMNYVFNIIPFPGTKVFDQAMRDNLFIGDFIASELWRGEINLDPVADEVRFFIKPYHMDMDELQHYRKLFDQVQFFSKQAKVANACA